MYQHSAMVALRKNQGGVVVVWKGGEPMGSGRVQSVRWVKAREDWEVVVSDGCGGAFWFPLTEVTAIRWNDWEAVLVEVANWQAEGGAK